MLHFKTTFTLLSKNILPNSSNKTQVCCYRWFYTQNHTRHRHTHSSLYLSTERTFCVCVCWWVFVLFCLFSNIIYNLWFFHAQSSTFSSSSSSVLLIVWFEDGFRVLCDWSNFGVGHHQRLVTWWRLVFAFPNLPVLPVHQFCVFGWSFFNYTYRKISLYKKEGLFSVIVFFIQLLLLLLQICDFFRIYKYNLDKIHVLRRV